MKNKLSLGVFDGLQDELEESLSITDIKNIDISLLVPAKENFYKLDKMEELIEDIKEHTLYHNLLVKELDDGRYKIISGHRRYKALLALNYKEVPCKIVDKSINDIDIEIMMIKANSTNRNYDDDTIRIQVQKLEQLYKAKKSSGESVKGKLRDKIGENLGLSGSQVQKYLQVNKKLIPELKELLDIEKITLTDAFDITKCSEDQQKNICELLKANLDNKKAVIENLNNKINNLSTELNKKSTEVKSIESKNQELLNKVENLNKDIASKDEKLNSLNSNIDSIKQQIEKEAKNKSANEVNSLKKRLEKLEVEKSNLKNEKAELEDELASASDTSNATENKNLEINLNVELMAKNVKELIKKLFLTLANKEYEPGDDVKKVLQNLKDNEIKSLCELIQKTK